MEYFWPVLGAIFGACWGSFVHVVYGRTPRMLEQYHSKEKMTLWWSFPGSHCPICQHPLSWYENVPVLGWLLLRGRCRHCDTPIPARYLWWEFGWAGFGAGLASAYEWIGIASFWVVLLVLVLVELVWRHKDHTKTVDVNSKNS